MAPQVLASLLGLLVTARFQPPGAIDFGNRCMEHLLRLSQGKAGLPLKDLADAVRVLDPWHRPEGVPL